MIYQGRVQNGVVVLDGHIRLPEGTQVRIEPLEVTPQPTADSQIPSLYERLKPVIGAAKGLPSDLAKNHDHYLYGVPKKR